MQPIPKQNHDQIVCLFQVYVVELQCDVTVCSKRNTHRRTQRELEKVSYYTPLLSKS